MEHKTVYIVLSRTGTITAKVIRCLTNDRYSHASLSLDNKLDTMYSFGRLNAYNPFFGGFVVESPNRGVFRRFRDTEVEVLEIPISKSKYKRLEKNIRRVEKNRKRYTYNYLGLFLAPFNICFKHNNWYYCSEFVHDELVRAGVINSLNIGIIRPIRFESLEQANIVYTGLLREYKPAV